MKIFIASLFCLFAFNLAAEIIPYAPGTVIASRESLKDWQIKAVSEKSVAMPRGHGIALQHYAKSTVGKFILSKKFKTINCADFDRFIYEPMVADYRAKPKQIITGFLETDCGTIKSIPPKAIDARNKTYYSPCIVFDVSKAKVIKSIRLEVTLAKDGIANGMLWIGMFLLRNSTEHNTYMKHYQRFADLKWEGLIQSESYEPKFKLQYEVLFSNADLEKYRNEYSRSSVKANVKNMLSPEHVISKNIGSNYQTADGSERLLRYLKTPYSSHMRAQAMELSFRAILRKDKELMRMAARYILSIAAFDAWNDDPREDTVGRYRWPAFNPSWHLYSLAIGLDCAGEMLTPTGRNYVLKAMMLKGVAPIMYSLWERNYAFKMNQGVSFLRGKFLALCIMDKVWPRVTPILENTKRESDECMSRLFKSDGSFMESISYLAYTLECTLSIYEAYSMQTKKPFSEVIPQCMKSFGGYAEVVASTCIDYNQVLIPLGQGHNWFNLPLLTSAFLATGCPGSMWVNLYKKVSAENKQKFFKQTGFCKGLRAMKWCALADKAAGLTKPKNFILLKKCGLTSSLRELNGKKVKIVVVGDAAEIGKKAFDTSSFVLEFAGDAFAMQMPVYNGVFFESQYRNMTVPILENGLYANQKNVIGCRPQSARSSQCPVAGGDATSFKCKVDAKLSWDRLYFKQYMRTIDSPAPDSITITDEYKLGRKAAGAAFMLITYLDVKIKDGNAVISGNHGGKAQISVNEGCKIKVEKFTPTAKILKGMSMKAGTKLNRLIISKAGKRGDNDKIVVKIKLMTS